MSLSTPITFLSPPSPCGSMPCTNSLKVLIAPIFSNHRGFETNTDRSDMLGIKSLDFQDIRQSDSSFVVVSLSFPKLQKSEIVGAINPYWYQNIGTVRLTCWSLILPNAIRLTKVDNETKQCNP